MIVDSWGVRKEAGVWIARICYGPLEYTVGASMKESVANDIAYKAFLAATGEVETAEFDIQ